VAQDGQHKANAYRERQALTLAQTLALRGACSAEEPSATKRDSATKAKLKRFIEDFIAYFNETMAKPLRWTFTGEPLAP
jgi:hypothetical protein